MLCVIKDKEKAKKELFDTVKKKETKEKYVKG